MQYPIPQFIEEEAKIIAFLTFRQFFWLVGAGIVCIVWYNIFPFWLFIGTSLATAILVAAIAFIKIDNASLLKVLFHFLNFSLGEKNYTWKKKESTYPFKIQKTRQLTPIETPQQAAQMQPSKLSNVKKMIETKR